MKELEEQLLLKLLTALNTADACDRSYLIPEYRKLLECIELRRRVMNEQPLPLVPVCEYHPTP